MTAWPATWPLVARHCRRPHPATDHWVVEHCTGPLGLGTLIVKPLRHVVHVAELNDAEAAELGPLLRQASAIAGQLVEADQVYNCLWSHGGAKPGHVHYVVQPVAASGGHGPRLQVAMFDAAEHPEPSDVEAIAERARALFGTLPA